MYARRIATALGALLLSLAFTAGAGAAPQVAVTYDLGATPERALGEAFPTPRTVLWNSEIKGEGRDFEGPGFTNPVNLVVSDMTVVYQSDSGTSPTGIQTGPATIQSMQLAWSGHIDFDQEGTVRYNDPIYEDIFTFNKGLTLTLTQPVTNASLTAGGHLTAPLLNLHLDGTIRDRLQETGYFPSIDGTAALDVPVGSVGTIHWIDGRTPAAGEACTYCPNGTTGGGGYFDGTGKLRTGSFAAPSATYYGNFLYFYGFPREVTLVGREVGRTPIPEPGSLLLLSSGLAGLATLGGTGALGRRLRRRRHEALR